MQPTAKPPKLFDRDLLLQRRKRAATEPVDFLHVEIADQLQERLTEVNRRFTSPAVIGPVDKKFCMVAGLKDAQHFSDDPTLTLGNAKHDLVIHAFSLHSANDPVGQMIQSRLALKPDGLFVGILFAGRTLQELRTALAQAETEILGGLSPRVAPMADLRDLGGLLQRAGFALPVADTVTMNTSYQTPQRLMHDLRFMGETNVMHARHRIPMRRALLNRAVEIYRQKFPASNNRIKATFEIAFLTGWYPSADQPKPLRPGSAQARLADALGTAETKLNEDDNG